MIDDIQGDELLQLISLGPDAPGSQTRTSPDDEMVELVSYGASQGLSIAGASGVDEAMTELTSYCPSESLNGRKPAKDD